MTSTGAQSPKGPRAPSLRARLIRAIAVLAATLLAVSALSMIAVTRLGGAIGLILKENYVSVVVCQEMNEALERQDSAALFAVIGHDELARPVLLSRRADFAAALAREANNITLPGEGALVREVDRLYRGYLVAVDSALAGPDSARVDAYFQQLLPRFHALKDKVTAIRLMNQRNMEWADGEARRIARRTREVAILVTAAALLLAAWFVRRFPQTVLEPIASFTNQARAIGEGKLEARVPIPEVHELRVLAEALSRMQEKLKAYRESSLGELLAAKDLSRATIASMVDPVIVFSARGGVLLVNELAEAIFGLAPRDAEQRRESELEVPEPIAAARDAVLANGKAIFPQSLAEAMRWVTPEGERYFLVRASPLQNDEAGAAAIVVAQDVTRFRRIDALKSDVVATVSHELKTPLTSLRLATHMLLERSTGDLTELQRELALTARDETERLQSTVDELLDLVKIEREAGELRMARVSPSALLREVASAHQKLAETRHVAIEIDAADGSSIELDPEQISMVIGNLLSNAIRHSRDGGRVWLESRIAEQEQLISVRDEGEGIAPEHIPHIFERHWSGAEPATLKGRHGLGLAIAKEIVARHNGTLEVESQLGRGSTFRLRIPRRGRGISTLALLPRGPGSQ